MIWPVVHTFHTKSYKFVTDVKIKARDESKLNDNPDSGHLYKNNFQTFQLRISVHCECLFVFLQWLIDKMTDLQAILGGTLRAPGIHGEIEIKVSEPF